MSSDWLAFWDSAHSIYVNARHKEVHYRLIAKEIARLMPARTARVLNYGSGEAIHADEVASVAGELLLCEAAPGVRTKLRTRFGNHPNIRVATPEDVARQQPQTLDLIVLHSVAQYLTTDEIEVLFELFHRLLKTDGLLVVGDVIPPHVPAATDASALLRFAASNGFFFAAVGGLLRTFFSDYWRLRSRLGLTRYAEAEMLEKLSAAGFAARRTPENLGHNQARMAFHARPR